MANGYLNRLTPGAVIPVPNLQSLGLAKSQAVLLEYLRLEGLEAQFLVPSAFDSCPVTMLRLKNISAKLVQVDNGDQKFFLEPGETVTLDSSPELRAIPLNNGVDR